MGLLHEYRQIRKKERGENQIGLGRLERGNMAGQIHGPDLRPLLGDDLVLDVEAFEHCNECRHVVAAIGIVRIDPGHGRELALQYLIASSEDMIASHSLSVLRNRYRGLGSFSSTPSWVVPSQ